MGISNVSRKYDLPNHPDLLIVPPRMSLYLEKNKEILSIFRKYATEEDILIYSIDEAFIKVTNVKKLFKADAYQIARMIQQDIFHHLNLYTTAGIGDNMLLAKLALDNEAKYTSDMKAEWRYNDVQSKIWTIHPITNFWGIGNRTALRLHRLGINTIKELALANPVQLKNQFGVIGEQLYAHSWGIDRSDITEKHLTLEKSYSNSQILTKDYIVRAEIELVIKEMADQVARRIRQHHCQTTCIHLTIGYSSNSNEVGFSRQMKISATNSTKLLAHYCLLLFNKYYSGAATRQISITYSKFIYTTDIQLDLFQEPDSQIGQLNLELLVDHVRDKYGFASLVHASSLTNGATAIKRSHLLGGHASGLMNKKGANSNDQSF